jgi:GPR1/FUN34/yaaH family
MNPTITPTSWRRQMVELLLSSKDFRLPVATSTTGLSHLSLSYIAALQTQLLWDYCPLLPVRIPLVYLQSGFTNRWAGIFLISIFGVKVRGVATPNVLIGVLIFFGGVCQFIAGIMEFISGNTVSCSCILTASSLLSFFRFSLVQPFSPLTEHSTYHMA